MLYLNSSHQVEENNYFENFKKKNTLSNGSVVVIVGKAERDKETLNHIFLLV